LNNDEYTAKSIMIEGILSIQAGENPRVTEEKLKSFLSPADKAAFDAGNGNGGGGEE
jgi:chemotaxis protein MotA